MKSPFITTADAAEYLLFIKAGGQPDLKRLHKFLHAYRLTVRTVKRGGSVLIDKASLDAHLNRESAQTRRRNRGFQSRASHFQQGQCPRHSPHVSSDPICDVHAAQDARDDAGTLVNSIEQVTR